MKRSEMLLSLRHLLSTFDNSYPDSEENIQNAETTLNMLESDGMLPPNTTKTSTDDLLNCVVNEWESEGG